MGSSPLTRGKRSPRLRPPRLTRLIPAHAGKTPGPVGAHQPSGAHPRSRGENKNPEHAVKYSAGSSPLTRGKRMAGLSRSPPARLIPAHAGKTGGYRSSRLPRWAHPRSRGENSSTGLRLTSCQGSSPLTRGKPLPGARGDLRCRLIPAHAGKTMAKTPSWRSGRAHPRSRGENDPVARLKLCAQGSSPLTRGKRGRVCGAWMPRGLIPAHAGKTPVSQPDPSLSRAHPRSRGEN